MMRQGNFGGHRGQYGGNRGYRNDNYGGRQQGNFGGRPNRGGGGGYQGNFNRQNQGNNMKNKGPVKNEPPKKEITPAKPAVKPEEVKQSPVEKAETKTQNQNTNVNKPVTQSPAKKEAITPAKAPAQSPVSKAKPNQIKKDETMKSPITGNGTSADTPKQQNDQQKQQPRQQYGQGRQDSKQERNFQNQRQRSQNRLNKEKDQSITEQAMEHQPTKDEKKFTGRCRLFVGNLTPDVSEEDFKKLFEQYGEVSEAYVNSGRGFGFIRMDYRHNAEAAKAGLDGLQRKGRTLRVRFATHGAALKVKNIHQYASNELLENAFAQFGDLERAIVIVDDRGKPTGEGIVEFVRKPGAQQALRRINEGIFLLGSSPRPLFVEPLEQTDEADGMPEKFINRNEGYKKERENEPRFAKPGSFEYEFAQRWRQIDDMEKERHERVKKEIEDARLRLEDEMQGALYEYQAEQIRKDLMRQQEELRRLEEMRQQDQMRRRQDMEMRQREEERMRAEEDRRRQEMMMRQDMGRQDMVMSRHGPMDQGGPRGREDMMGGMRDGPGPRGMKEGAPPLPPPPAPPAGMGLDRSGRPNQMPGGGNMGGSYSGMGSGGPGSMGGGSMGSGSNSGNMGGMGPGGMQRQSRFDQPGGSFDPGFAAGGGNMGGPIGGNMGGNIGGGGGGGGNMFGSPGMGGGNMGGSGSGNGGPGMRGDRRREAAQREEYGDVKRMRRY